VIGDLDDGPLFWIGLAEAQWTFGEVDGSVLAKVKADILSGAGLDRWEEAGAGALAKRGHVLEKFVEKVSTPNPRPRRPPKLIIRPSKFKPGDCLAVLLTNGQYGAALVLAADDSRPEYGSNLVGTMDYMAPEKPGIELFEKRNWLRVTHHNWDGSRDVHWFPPWGFRKAKSRIEVIGCVRLKRSDPKDSPSYSFWDHIADQVIYQRDWDAGIRVVDTP
jgi:hypothetical protein